MIWNSRPKKDDQLDETRFDNDDNEHECPINHIVDEDIQKQHQLSNSRINAAKYKYHQKRANRMATPTQHPFGIPNAQRQHQFQEFKQLQVKQKEAAIKNQTPNTKQTKIAYKLYNETKFRTVSDEILTKKLIKDYNIFNLSSLKRPNSRSQLDQKSHNEDNNENQRGFNLKRRRYFDNDASFDYQRRQVRCFNCGKQGHLSSKCMSQKKKIKCYYCLDEHHYGKCPEIVCGKCGEKGHSHKECNVERINLKCYTCNKVGHYANNCGVVVMSSFRRTKKQSKQSKESMFDLGKTWDSDMVNVRCLNNCSQPYGHYSCVVHKKQDMRYNTSENEGSALNSEKSEEKL